MHIESPARNTLVDEQETDFLGKCRSFKRLNREVRGDRAGENPKQQEGKKRSCQEEEDMDIDDQRRAKGGQMGMVVVNTESSIGGQQTNPAKTNEDSGLGTFGNWVIPR
jgi:hypothetical protein